MPHARLIRQTFVALLVLGAAAPAFAEEGEATEEPADDVTESVLSQTEEGTTVFVAPPPEPTVRNYDPASETDQDAEAEERAPREQLHPDGEVEMMADHPVDRGDIKFRPGKGVEINSADDDFQLRIRVRVQFLWTVLSGEVGPREADEPDEVTNNFRIRRARFVFQGHAFGKHNQYKLEIDPLRADNVVLDYYLDFTKNRDIQVRIGQYKISSNRTRVISSGNLQMVDRATTNAEFTLDRDIGIDIRSRDFLGLDKMRYVLGIFSGTGLNNPQFKDFAMVYLFRVEYLPLGIFRDYSEVDFQRTKPRLSLGATYAFFQNADRARGMIGAPFADGGTANYNFVYVDAIFKARGFSAVSEFSLRTGKRNLGTITEDEEGNPILPTAPRNGFGWMLQAGYLIPNTRFEFAARGSLIFGRNWKTPTSLRDSYAGTFSVSYYFARHPFKIQADVSQIWNEQELFGQGETTFRLQLQASL